VTFVSTNITSGSITGSGTNALSWNLGNLATNSGATLTIVVRPFSAGFITNSAVVSSSTTDLNLDDNSASYVVIVQPPQPPQISGDFLTSNGRIFALTISNPTNPPASVIIQASTNLVTGHWVNVYTSTPPFTFTNLDSTNYPMRFYRALLGP
jgi:hypothetical protein